MTTNYYNNNADSFFNDTINADMTEQYNLFLKELPESGEILDLGCGSGRDTKYFSGRGYEVTAIDASKELAIRASEFTGQKVLVQDMRTIEYEDKFVGIWACASLLHLTESDIATTIAKCLKALKSGGVLYASFKYGTENYSKDGREFTCMTEEKFSKLLKTIPNYAFRTPNYFVSGDVREGRAGERWLNIILHS